MINFYEKAAYGVGAFAKDAAITIVYLFLMLYLTDTVGLNPAFVGTLFLLARLWDAVNDPMMGVLIDNTKTKWGKFKPWILFGTIFHAIVLVLLFWQPSFIPNMYIYISIIYILWGMTYTLMDVPFWAMLPSIAREQKDRTQLASILGICANIAWLIMGAFGLTMIKYFSGGATDTQDQGMGFLVLSIILASVLLIGTIIMICNIKHESTIDSNKQNFGFREAFRIINKNDQLLIYIVIVLLYNLGKGLSSNSSIYYFRYIVGNTELFSFSQGFAGLITILGLFFFPILQKIVGRKKLFKLGIFIPIFGHIIFAIGSTFLPNSLAIIFLRTIALGLGDSFILGATIVMIADIVDYGEEKLGMRNESTINSLRTFLIKAASAFNGWFIGIALSLSGYVANQPQTEVANLTIKSLMYLFPIICLIFAYIVYKEYYQLHNDVEEDIKL